MSIYSHDCDKKSLAVYCVSILGYSWVLYFDTLGTSQWMRLK